MATENLNINGYFIPHNVITILGDGACLFRAISYLMYHTDAVFNDIRLTIVKYVADNWTEFSIMSHNKFGNNYPTANEYLTDMSQAHVFGGLCELVAAGKIYPFLFEVYFNGEIYAKFGNEFNPVRRLRFSGQFSKGHFDVYIPVYEINNTASETDIESKKEYQFNTNKIISFNTNKKTSKRRARYSDKTRKKQLKEAKKKYVKNNYQVSRTVAKNHYKSHLEAYRSASKKYQSSHPEVNRAAVEKYQSRHAEVQRAATHKYRSSHREVHKVSQQKYEKKNPGLRNECRLRPWKKKTCSGFSYDPEIAYGNDIGTMNNKCPLCHAKKFKRESPGMCCSNGKVTLPPLSPPPEPLNSLLTGYHPEHRHFTNRIRQYNGCFQMTSFGAKQIVENGFMPTFKVEGQIYHLCGSLRPEPEQEAQFLQIYFVGDDEKEAHLRSRKYPDVKLWLVKQLQQMLHEVNNYIKDLKTALDKMPPECENFQVVIHADRKPANAHKGRFNVPSASEVALVIVGQQFERRDIILESRDNKLKRISELHRSYDALQYPLMFCNGEDGYSIDIFQQDPTTKVPLLKTVSAAQFYTWRIMSRDGEENYLLRYCALLSQFLVDEYGKIETERLNYLRHNQSKLRADEYIHLRDEVGRHDADQIGQKIVLPSSFTGGPRYMHEKAQDAMTYVRLYGSSDLFITFTCNPKWKEIQQELYPGQKHYQRHDIIARVFHIKVKEFMDLIIKGELFGKVRCHMFSVEWQKRGLPHIHCLLWLKEGITPDIIDEVVSAEIPDIDSDPLLFDVVKANMIHGPCGTLNRFSPCMKDGCCTKRYPRPFVQETQKGKDGYPLYRRRTPKDGGLTVNIKGVELDNRWVVPYNAVLLRTFEAHINVEISNSVKSIKYICKYITKGNDQAAFVLKSDVPVNEIEIYECGRYISSSEAVWKIFGFPIHERHPTVIHLAVHLENGQRVYFTADNLAKKLENPPMTTLLAFFRLCQIDEFSRTLLYYEVPSYYVWQQNKSFTRRKRGENVDGWPGIKKDSALGRVYTIHPNNVECYHLRLLLHHVRGPTSFSYLKTVKNVEYPTFKAACIALGLLEDDKQWHYTMDEAVLRSSAFKLRELFAVILVFCRPSDPRSLWEKYKESFAEDILFQYGRQLQGSSLSFKDKVYNRCLMLIEDAVLTFGGQHVKDYGLPQPEQTESHLLNREFLQETNFNLEDLMKTVYRAEASLTDEQADVYQTVLNSVQSGKGQIFFLDAPGGTGKTFLLNLLLSRVRSNKGIALATASSGIAATLLEGGKTAHSAFKLPLNLSYSDNPLCSIKKQSNLAQVLRDCKLIIWDESTMAHKGGFEALNATLKDIRNSDEDMGGVTVVLAGDFRQTLPVVPRGTRANEIKACIKSSYLWPQVKKLCLKKNMRVYLKGDASAGLFSDLLLKIGDGRYPEFSGKIMIPQELAIVVTNLADLITKVYPDIADIKIKTSDWLCERAILSPKNDTAAEINTILLKSFKGEDHYYKSVDTTTNQEEAVQYPEEFLNSLTPPGFPPHMLHLKVGTPVMLLRNLCPPKLCNGTRLRVTSLHKHLVEAMIITGSARGDLVLIPRIPLIPSDYPFEFRRLQFPIKVCFAITINKAQGQTLKVAGIDLREDCFSHGQFYVACSRVSSPMNLIILSPEKRIKNIVYKEVLD